MPGTSLGLLEVFQIESLRKCRVDHGNLGFEFHLVVDENARTDCALDNIDADGLIVQPHRFRIRVGLSQVRVGRPCSRQSPVAQGWKLIDCSAKDSSRSDGYKVTFVGTEAEANQAGVGSTLRGVVDCPLPTQDCDFVVCFNILRNPELAWLGVGL